MSKYLKVKPEYDCKQVQTDWFVIGNELLTEREVIDWNIPYHWLDEVEVPEDEVYEFFGCRLCDIYPVV